MKYVLYMIVGFLSLQIASVSAANEVTKCFEKAWGHPDNGGLGLHRAGAIELCKGTKNSNEVTKCFEKAWGHPNNGGLGLHRAGAIDLCKSLN